MNQMINIEGKPHQSMIQMTAQGLALAESVVASISHLDIGLKISSYGMIGLDYIHTLFEPQDPEVICISQRIQGALQGHVLFMLDNDSCMQLMRGLLKENARLRELTEMEEEALLEFGNIIINSCLCSYLRLNQCELTSHLPRLDRDHYTQIINEYRPEIFDGQLFYTQLQVSLNDKIYTACLLWTKNR